MRPFEKFASFALRTALGRGLRGTLGRLWDEPTLQLANKPALESRTGFRIPNQLVQTWETKEFGKRHANSIQSFRQVNPDIDFLIFDAQERDSFMSTFSDPEISSIYFDAKFGTMRADIFRYSFVFQNGGYYADISLAWTRSISSLHQMSDTGFVGFEGNDALFVPPKNAFTRLLEPTKLACVWGFGFIPEHPILSYALEYIKHNAPKFRDRLFEVPKSAIISLTGPVAFTNAIWRYLDERDDPDLSQNPNDFYGDFLIHPGAGYRHLQFPSYSRVTNARIL